jgi:hypothetical protein
MIGRPLLPVAGVIPRGMSSVSVGKLGGASIGGKMSIKSILRIFCDVYLFNQLQRNGFVVLQCRGVRGLLCCFTVVGTVSCQGQVAAQASALVCACLRDVVGTPWKQG